MAAFGHEFIERSAFDYTPVLKHQDPRGIADGGETMGDHEGGAALHHFVESGIHLRLGDGVECAGRLVQDQDWRILQQCTGDRQPLALAARQHAAALAGVGLEAAAALDEFERLRALGRFPHLGLGGVRLADAQILRDRAVEQQRLLKDDADVSPQRCQRDPAHVHAVDPDEAGLRIEGAMQQRNRCRLAGAGCADQRDSLAGSAVKERSSTAGRLPS